VEPLPQVGDRAADEIEIVLAGDAQLLAHVEIPGLGDDACDRRAGVEDHLEVLVRRRLHPGARRRAEGDDPRLLQRELRRRTEEGSVARIRSRPAALDVVDAEGVDLLGDRELCIDGQRDLLALAAVAQSRVVELDAAHQPSSPAPPSRASWSERTASSAYFAA